MAEVVTTSIIDRPGSVVSRLRFRGDTEAIACIIFLKDACVVCSV